MKLPYRIVLMIVVMVATCFASDLGFTKITQEDIGEDVVWDIDGSPYVVYGNLYITNGATLRIEDGVTVRFDKITMDGGRKIGAEIIISDGTLIAEGSPGWPIVFTSNEDIPFPGDWGAIVIEGDNPVNLTNCRIEYAKEGLLLWNISLSAGMASTVNSLEITNCSEHGIGMVGGSPPDISKCTLTDNGSGMPYEGGIYLMDCTTTLNHNNLFDNAPNDMINDSVYNIDATFNWWGTINETQIAEQIFDYNDRSTLGVVDFRPYLTEPAGDGGSVAMSTWGSIKYDNEDDGW
jgi:hypothetical protein